MVTAVSRRISPTHEDWAVLFIELPQDEVHYANIRDVSTEILLQHKRVRIREMQISHLGQALVRFEDIYVRQSNFPEPSSVWRPHFLFSQAQ
jgi:hypothetical protein